MVGVAKKVLLKEVDYSFIPDYLLNDCDDYGKAHQASLLIEYLFNSCRRASRRNHVKKLEPQSMWYIATCTAPDTTEFDRPTLPITAAAKIAQAKNLPDEIFKVEPADCTVPDEDLNHLKEKKPSWPNPGPERHRYSPVMSLTVVQLEGAWLQISRSWLSLFAVVGSILGCRSEKFVGLVISVTPYGVLRFRCGRSEEGGERRFFDFQASSSTTAVMVDAITKPDDLRVFPTRVVCPAEKASHGP